MCEISRWMMLLFLIVCSISDLRRRSVKTVLLVGMSVLLLFFCIFVTEESLLSVGIGAVIGSVSWLFSYWTRESLGYADSWIILLIGVYLGGEKTLYLLTLSFLAAGIFSLVLLVWKRWSGKMSIPFIPFLTISYIGVMAL